jgi:hypothetical protein
MSGGRALTEGRPKHSVWGRAAEGLTAEKKRAALDRYRRPTDSQASSRWRMPQLAAMRPISAAGLTSPPCVSTCVMAISLVRGPIGRSKCASAARAGLQHSDHRGRPPKCWARCRSAPRRNNVPVSSRTRRPFKAPPAHLEPVLAFIADTIPMVSTLIRVTRFKRSITRAL